MLIRCCIICHGSWAIDNYIHCPVPRLRPCCVQLVRPGPSYREARQCLATLSQPKQQPYTNRCKVTTGGWFNIKATSYQYRKSHCGDKTILRPSYLHNVFSYTGKMSSIYRTRALVLNWLAVQMEATSQRQHGKAEWSPILQMSQLLMSSSPNCKPSRKNEDCARKRYRWLSARLQ